MIEQGKIQITLQVNNFYFTNFKKITSTAQLQSTLPTPSSALDEKKPAQGFRRIRASGNYYAKYLKANEIK